MTGVILSDKEINNILNEQDKEIKLLKKENEQLKSDNKKYIRGLDLAKATSQSWASDVRELREQNCQLEKENEQLRKEVNDLKTKIEYLRNPRVVQTD